MTYQTMVVITNCMRTVPCFHMYQYYLLCISINKILKRLLHIYIYIFVEREGVALRFVFPRGDSMKSNAYLNIYHPTNFPYWRNVAPVIHDDVIKWKHLPRYWPFVRGIHRSPVNSPHKGQWRRALMFSLICAWINDWVNNREAGDLKRHRARYDVTVMRD